MKSRHTMARLLTTLLLMLLAGSQSYAQFLRAVDTTKPPLRPMYGVGNDEFYIAGTFQKWGPVHKSSRNRDYYDLWNHAAWMGIPIVHVQINQNDSTQNDRFLSSNARQSNQRALLTLKPLNDMGWGQAIEFYAFDSVQSQLWPTKFLHRQGGDTNGNYNNPYPDQPNVFVQEELYTTNNTGANDSILWGVVYGYDSVLQKYRWVKPWMRRSFYSNDSVQKTDAFLKDRRDRPVFEDSINYLVVTGHLRRDVDQNSAVSNDSALLRIDIVYELPTYIGVDPNDNHNSYFNSSGQKIDVQQDMEFVCRSYYLRKQDLIDNNLAWNEYKEAVFPMSLRWCSDEVTRGPAHPDAASRSIDIRVHWLGVNEDVYLRSVSLRDYRGQMALGRTAEARKYRSDVLMKTMKKLMYGTSINVNNRVETYPVDSLRRHVIGFQCGEEQFPNEYGAFNGIAKMVADSFNLARYKGTAQVKAGDSLLLFSHDLGQRSFAEVSRNPQTGSYLYINSTNDTMAVFLGPDDIRPDTLFESEVHQIPSIIEHNGGRGHLPLLELTADGVEKYNTAFQRLFVGYYHPGQAQLYTNRNRYWPGMLGYQDFGCCFRCCSKAMINCDSGRSKAEAS
ncbi:MAG: hypothetical protein IPM61_15720 [Chlorobi bacterium]|nr:hypothetical protein [Chlorobiota bacterium]